MSATQYYVIHPMFYGILRELGSYIENTESIKEEFIESPDGIKARFKRMQIKNELNERILAEIIKATLDVDRITIRCMCLTSYSSSSYTEKHTDTAFTNCKTVTVRLDAHEEERLKVNSVMIKEPLGSLTMFNSNTPHEVTIGKFPRQCLVAWISHIEHPVKH